MKKNEIVSFNETVLDVSSLLGLEDAELDQVIGGALSAMALEHHCESYKSDNCAELTSCGTYNSQVQVIR